MTANGRKTIPVTFRQRFGIKKGNRFVFTEQNGKIVLEKFERGYFLYYAGILGTGGEMLKGLMREKEVIFNE